MIPTGSLPIYAPADQAVGSRWLGHVFSPPGTYTDNCLITHLRKVGRIWRRGYKSEVQVDSSTYVSASSQPPAIPISKQTVASCPTLPQNEDKPEIIRKPDDDPVFPGAYPIDKLEQCGSSQLPFFSKLSFFS
jgi:hypothetical protein